MVFWWTRRYFGPAAGVLAICLFTMIPTILAHAGLATTDMGLAACLGAAFLAMLIWVEEPTNQARRRIRVLHGAGHARQVHHAGIFSGGRGHRAGILPGGRASRHRQAHATGAGACGQLRHRGGRLPVRRVGGLLLLVRQGAGVECEPACLGILRRHPRGLAAQHKTAIRRGCWARRGVTAGGITSRWRWR